VEDLHLRIVGSLDVLYILREVHRLLGSSLSVTVLLAAEYLMIFSFPRLSLFTDKGRVYLLLRDLVRLDAVLDVLEALPILPQVRYRCSVE